MYTSGKPITWKPTKGHDTNQDTIGNEWANHPVKIYNLLYIFNISILVTKVLIDVHC